MTRFDKCGGLNRAWLAIAVVGCLALRLTAAPATNANNKARDKQPINSRGVVIPRDTPNNPAEKPERKERSDKTQPAADIKELVARFQKERDTYLSEQQNLLNQLRNASDEERKAIREQLRESLERWKEQQKELLKEQRERAQELKKELQADLGKVVDEAKGEGRGR
jgi:flagellar motility protein MotE (MotC chaperone)